MPISARDVFPPAQARAKPSELADEVEAEAGEKSVTSNGDHCGALIDAERLDHYRRLERERIHPAGGRQARV